MKKLVLFVAVACLLAACKDENEDIIAQYFFGGSEVSGNQGKDNETPGQVPENGLVAFFPLDENLTDMCGNLLAMTWGSVKVVAGHKDGSRCAHFLGTTNSYIVVTYSDLLQMDEWAINLWFYYDNSYDKKGVLMQMGRADVPGSFLIGTNLVRFVNQKGVAQYAPLYDREDKFPTATEWHIITTSVKGTQVAIHLDGKLQFKGSLSAAYVNEVTSHMIIGASRWDGTTNMLFNGLIDDVRIYNRILTDEEVRVLYKN